MHGLDLVDQLPVELGLGRSDLLALLSLCALVGQCGDQLIAAHPDVAVDAPYRQHDPVVPERPVPRDRVLVVGVDERAVDIEDRDRRAHAKPWA